MHQLTKPQKLIYEMEKYAGGAISVICGSILLDGQRDASELARAANAMFRCNEALRTRITEKDGQVVQEVVDFQEQTINVLRFDSKEALDIYAEEYASQPIPLDGPLCELQAVLLPERYGLMAKCHHLIGDAWTLTLLASQLCTLLAGEEPQAFPYSDYIASESKYLQSDRREKDKTFFLEQFKSCPEATHLSERAGNSYIAHRSAFQIGAEQAVQLRAYAKSHKISPFVLFFSAFSIYFSRVKNNAEQFYIGTPILNRGNFREKNTVGMFINTVPVLAHVDYSRSFAASLDAMQNTVFSVLRHQKFHYSDLLSSIRQQFGFTETLYDVILSYQNACVVGAETRVETAWYHSGTQTESLQIHIDDRDGEGVFRVQMDYRADKFTGAEIQRMYGHILNLLLDGIAHDEKGPGELTLLSRDEERLLLTAFNATAADYPREKCVHQLFEEQAERTPDKTAVIACDRTLTYRELNGEANRIAHGLIAWGVRPGDIVAFALPRNSHLIPAMFGILKAGAAYLPIDPDYPQERIDYMLQDSGARAFVTADKLPKLMENNCIDNPNIELGEGDLFCALHTSGSTGMPKISLLKQSGVTNWLFSNLYLWDGIDTSVSTTIATFDAFVIESVLTLTQGHKIIFASEDDIFNQGKFEELFSHSTKNLFVSTPTKLKNYVRNNLHCPFLKNIRHLIVGGEIFEPALYNTIKETSSQCAVYNCYGPTETTVCSTNTEILQPDDITIGRPIANTQIYIVDKYLSPVPIGVTGELCIAGDGVGAGYLNRPELTAEKFIPNPFGPGRMYRTGDLAYWREDGNIVYVGRNDFQVKIRGLRIELGEIENAVAAVPGVSQAVAVVRKDDTGRQLICAFYTETAPVELEVIRSALRERLPRYMMPHIFTRLDVLPLTSSGKVNRKGLPEVDLSALVSEVEYVAPITEQETVLAAAVAQVLGLERVGMQDNFFDLGGDSLKAIELSAALDHAGYRAEVKTVFEMDTLGELAARLIAAEEAELAVPEGDVPATAAQMRVYTAQSISGGTAYNVPYAFKVKNLDPVRLQAAVDGLAVRHEILRTRFEERNGQIMQVVDGAARCSVEKLDSGDIAAFVRPFDLGTAPLLRVGYFENTVLLDMHHIITDGGSMPVFLRELNELYMGRELAAQPVQYRAFAAKEHGSPEDESYWLSVFSDEVPALELNTDFPRQGRQSFAGTAVYETIFAELHEKICMECRKLGITPYAFYMGAFHILLSKFGGGEDTVVGFPASGRGGKFLDALGMFVNTLALRGKPEGEKTVRDFLNEIRAASVDALAHQDYPYGELVKKLDLRPEGRNPLFDVMLAYQSEKMTEIIFGDEPAELLPVPVTSSKYDFTFNILPRQENVVLMVEYCTALFREGTIRRFIAGYRLLLEQMLDTGKQLKDLSAMTEAERCTLLTVFNDTAADYPREKCVHQLFEEQAERTPDKTAVIACDRTLTYRELNGEANRIAHGLIAGGVRPGDIVAFALPRNSHLIPTMFGILKTCAAYLPIDPDYPRERIDYMLQDSGARAFVTADKLPELLENGDTSNPALAFSSQNPCYCIYTSGSTGRPKGTLQTHQNVGNYVNNNNNNNVVHAVIRNDYDSIVSITTVGFDIFVTESILPLVNGMTVLFADDEQAKLQAKLETLLQKHPADVLQTTPTKMRTLMFDPEKCGYLKNLKAIILGGEALDSALVSDLRKLTPAHIFNIYGPTETTVWSTNTEVLQPDDITIGRPIANTQIYIVDKYLSPVPIGVTGELCIAGDGVGAGYLNRPELTAEKFIPNPFGPGRMYRTGDLAYWREDGNIVYVGRNDFQVKIRGLRIELGEIENAIAAVPGVSQAVAVVRKDNTGRQLICAFYTETAPVEPEAIRSALRERLPRYMMPHIFTRLDALPLTSSGKVNRKGLPEVDLSALVSEVEYVAPITEQETVLAAAVAQVLGLERVGMQDNFFDLGGDSLKAIELSAALDRAGYRAEVKTVFEMATLGELAARLTAAEEAELAIPEGDVPATAAQMRVYTAQSISGGTAYNVPYAFKVGHLDPARLQAAVDGLAARHEILRTRFEDRDGQIMQVVDGAAGCSVEKLDSGDVAAFVRPFDLGTAPLLRVGYFENTVLLDMHHIITDGGSMPVFLRELNELYMGRELSAQPVQYRAFAARKQEHTVSEQYWLSVFSNEVPALELNTDLPRQGRQSFAGTAVYETISAELHAQICEKCKALGVTPYAFYMGAFHILLSKFGGGEDIVVGFPASGRGGKFLDALGMFVNTLALRGKPEGEKTVRDFLNEIRAASVDALAHQDYPYGELVKKLDLRPEGRNPLFDVMLAYQSEKMTEIIFGDEPAELLPVPVTSSKYDFTFNILPRQENVVLMVEYCTALFREGTIRRFIAGYRLLLEQMLDTGKQLKDLSAMTEAERCTLLTAFNDTGADYPREKCVHQLFEEQAERTPDKAAVIACDRTLTYRELNGEANRIAHGLIAGGVRPGDIVAFALPRNSHLIPTMFGILKAGAAYLPIDPDYPQERIDYMLRDSGARAFVTAVKLPELLENGDTSNPALAFSSQNPCYCIYTSGSTGRPKGTLQTHQNVGNYVNNNNNNNVVHAVIRNDYDSIVSTTTVGFDIFVTESILPLVNGMAALFADDEQAKLQAKLETLLQQHPADVLQTTPTKMRTLMYDPEKCEYLKNLKAIILGGEALDSALVSDLRKLTPAHIFNIYGPTETTVWSTNTEVLQPDDITIGRPIANTQIYIVDKYLSPVPIGVTGELCIAGDGVGAGYLNRPELTAEKFIPNPFGPGRMYRTGDLAYWREDGNIVYVGRNDFQVKIRGLRIELGEIENAIAAVPGVSQAVAVVRKDNTGRQLICAFYTETAPVEPEAIRSALRERLPRYMMPHIFTRLDVLPLTSSGKVNRKALPEVELAAAEQSADFVPPEGETEKRLAAIMEEVLQYSPIGRDDDFFDLGCDSLKGIEFLSKAHTDGLYFSLQNVFDYPTVRQLRLCMEKGDQPGVSYDDADFSQINQLLAKNRLGEGVPQKQDVGNLLLAGATGFLGIHILADYLDSDSGVAYCLVRGKSQADSEKRFEKLMDFYFGSKYRGLLGNRIQVLCGDLQKDGLGLDEQNYQTLLGKVNTVINTAASVKHYGSYQYFYEVNVETTRRLIQFCREGGAKLIHVSTLSVSGNSFADEFSGYISDTEKHFYESSLYIGQPLENVYARSKFEAERLVLEAMSAGLPANIMRMGNLTNRSSDGVFQINHETNAAAQRIRAVLELGVVPDYLITEDMYLEFTPIDEAAQAVMTVVRHFSSEQNVFHINSTKVVYLDKLMGYFAALDCPVRAIPGAEFATILREAARQAGTEHIFETFINDLDKNDRLNYDSRIRIENRFTEEYLNRLGFQWGQVGKEYLKKYVGYFRKIGFFK